MCLSPLPHARKWVSSKGKRNGRRSSATFIVVSSSYPQNLSTELTALGEKVLGSEILGDNKLPRSSSTAKESCFGCVKD